MASKTKTNFRWVICAMLFVATAVNYLDRQVLSLTWDEFIKPEFHWNESHYGTITSLFSIIYAICMLFAGRFVDWMGTKKGYLWAIGVWSAGACAHALCRGRDRKRGRTQHRCRTSPGHRRHGCAHLNDQHVLLHRRKKHPRARRGPATSLRPSRPQLNIFQRRTGLSPRPYSMPAPPSARFSPLSRSRFSPRTSAGRSLSSSSARLVSSGWDSGCSSTTGRRPQST